ncbi:MAG TPA: acyl carrier protein [Gemmatimonadales bacterium]|nr:acyl carrier protein [Gemmatimonadales bacterium]
MSKPIEAVIAETFRISPAAVLDTLAFNAIPEWDSLAHMDLMLALEAAYGVTIDEDRMLELTSVRAIREFLRDGARGA